MHGQQRDSEDTNSESSLHRARKFDNLCDEFESLCLVGKHPDIELFVGRVDEADKQSLLIELIAIEVHYRRQRAEPVALSEYQVRFPGLTGPSLEKTIQLSAHNRPVKRHIATPFIDVPTVASEDGDASKDHTEIAESFGGIDMEAVHVRKLRSIGHYRLEKQVGKGGMGVVYRAIDISLDRVVALKCIRNLDLATKDVKSRFEREALAAARLSHRNIVTVYEYGCDDDVPYIAMEFVEGRTLAEILRVQEKLDPNEAVALLRQIASAVGYAHDNGIIHRDLKPANILIDHEGCPRVADFGLARAELDFPKLTISGDILGTPSYMSPEQAAGRVDSVGRHSDVYSLGAILYECLTGVPPFRAENTQLTLMQVIEGSLVPPRKHRPELSRDVEIVCMKCLAKLLEHRYTNAHELVADLDLLLSEQPVRDRTWTALERLQCFIRDNVVLVSIAAAMVATLPIFFLRTPNRRLGEKEDGVHSTAIGFLNSLIETNPSNAVAWLRRAEHQWALGDFKSAMEDATRAKTLGNSQPLQTLLILGKCGLHFQDYPTAEAEFAAAVGLDDGCFEAWLGLGEARLKTGQFSKAIEDLTRAISLQPENGIAYEIRATAFEESGAVIEAKSDRQVAAQLTRNSASAH